MSKVDEVSRIEANGFYEDFLRLRFGDACGTPPNPPNRTMIGALMICEGRYRARGVGFETFSWDLVDLLPRMHKELPINGLPEDCLVNELLEDAGQTFDFVDLTTKWVIDMTGRRPGALE